MAMMIDHGFCSMPGMGFSDARCAACTRATRLYQSVAGMDAFEP